MSAAKLAQYIIQPKIVMEKYIVIICREGQSEIIRFETLEEAVDHADVHGAGWSETFVCEILMGPVV